MRESVCYGRKLNRNRQWPATLLEAGKSPAAFFFKSYNHHDWWRAKPHLETIAPPVTFLLNRNRGFLICLTEANRTRSSIAKRKSTR